MAAEALDTKEAERVEEMEKKLKEKKMSWGKLRRVDSLNLEAGRFSDFGGRHGSKVFLFALYLNTTYGFSIG